MENLFKKTLFAAIIKNNLYFDRVKISHAYQPYKIYNARVYNPVAELDFFELIIQNVFPFSIDNTGRITISGYEMDLKVNGKSFYLVKDDKDYMFLPDYRLEYSNSTILQNIFWIIKQLDNEHSREQFESSIIPKYMSILRKHKNLFGKTDLDFHNDIYGCEIIEDDDDYEGNKNFILKFFSRLYRNISIKTNPLTYEVTDLKLCEWEGELYNNGYEKISFDDIESRIEDLKIMRKQLLTLQKEFGVL